ncbi:hypothetical protein DFP72DRAFT_824677 [Ephemerocybe angulata]|uniref:Uncharacterized protein n=1 Tax=Ephemerocybe angulata TaxID=980116 RepID=A0A8H6LWE8_9AGAR|nr:hypothetical protein DFP72DRAFT_824677 [Tulosesus angulatus]
MPAVSAYDYTISSCFPHITNLACQAVLCAIGTDLGLAAVTETELTPEVEPVIRASSLRRQRFQDLQRAAGRDPLELLRDVETRWSSTLLMIERFLELKPYVIQMLRERDLEKYAIHEHEWEVLPIYKRILRVPHSFQQALSGEKTPTLHDSLPLFHTMITAWTAMKVSLPQYTDIIDAGISKLKEYWQRIHTVPAYTLAMRTLIFRS